jgi:hypothetical protein
VSLVRFLEAPLLDLEFDELGKDYFVKGSSFFIDTPSFIKTNLFYFFMNSPKRLLLSPSKKNWEIPQEAFFS